MSSATASSAAAIQPSKRSSSRISRIFGGRRVHGEGAVEHRLGGACAQGHRQALHDFGRIGTEHVDRQHLVGLRIDQQLHVAAFGTVDEGLAHRPEVGLEDLQLVARGQRLGLAGADGGQRRQGEHRDRDQAQVDFARLRCEQRIGQRPALGDRHRRQVPAVGDVADGVTPSAVRATSTGTRQPRRV
jgi:hypothetical protein